MNILVTGGAGYLGSVLVPKLLVRGHTVRVLDVGYFGVGHLRALRPAPQLIRDDLRRLEHDPTFADDLLDGCDCVIHLAAISNDPSADLNPELTEDVNYRATIRLAEAARDRSIRFLFSSSCSVYGEAEIEIGEEGALKPLTTYAVSKVHAERSLHDLITPKWSPIILRNGTLFGYSPRMRFDLVVNVFSLYSTLYGEIKIFGDGQQWRPYLHVRDCARAFVHFTESTTCEHVVYNVAHENLRVVDLEAVFRDINPHLRVAHVDGTGDDQRDYRVTTERMRGAGFHPRIGLSPGAEEMVEAMVTGSIPDPESIYYRNAKWLRELTNLGDRNHAEIAGLLETLVQVRLPR